MHPRFKTGFSSAFYGACLTCGPTLMYNNRWLLGSAIMIGGPIVNFLAQQKWSDVWENTELNSSDLVFGLLLGANLGLLIDDGLDNYFNKAVQHDTELTSQKEITLTELPVTHRSGPIEVQDSKGQSFKLEMAV